MAPLMKVKPMMKDKGMVMENASMEMVLLMKENGRMVQDMGKGSAHFLME